jgi:hypothetical protein
VHGRAGPMGTFTGTRGNSTSRLVVDRWLEAPDADGP